MMALLAVFAVSAVAASGASAHEWLKLNGEKVTAEEPSKTVGSIALHNRKIPALEGSGEIVVLCMGQFLGTVGPGTADSITGFESLTSTETNKLKCEVSTSTNSICKTGTSVTVEPVNLPWATKLTLTSTTIFDDITAAKGGEFGYKVTCNGIANECKNSLELSAFEKNISTGSTFAFREAEKAACAFGEGVVSAAGGLVEKFLVN